MLLVSLELAKAHLRVTHNAEDDLINLHIASASEWVQEWIARRYEDGDTVPAPVQSACLLYIGTLYKQRESEVTVRDGHVDTRAIEKLLLPYREDMRCL
jgi:uncharacterized phage protein (predicted DNA packaging)